MERSEGKKEETASLQVPFLKRYARSVIAKFRVIIS